MYWYSHRMRFADQIKGCLLALLLAAVSACVYAPELVPAKPSYASPPSADTRIAAYLRSAGVNTPRVWPIFTGTEALTTRIDLIDAADTTLDLQYFLWHNDPSGVLVIDRILAAADRGVRIRALVDDIQLGGLVSKLNALTDHPNIEIRIFNPFSVRSRFELGLFRLAEFAIDGNRLNHRMHNKLIVADNQVAILGGRNIGDDYFDLSPKRNFLDLDVMLTGAIVPDLSAGFDAYWNSRWAESPRKLLNLSPIPDDLQKLRKRVRKRVEERPDIVALTTAEDFTRTLDLVADAPNLTTYQTIVDDPDVGWFRNPNEIAARLGALARGAESEVLVATPYLIPSAEVLDIAEELTAKGVKIQAITNSLETNDVAIAQAAYARFRKRIVQTGIDLYEVRANAEIALDNIAEDISFHPKFLILDRRYVFIGSLNLDPRSLYLNTELGVLLDAPELVDQLHRYFIDMSRPENAWRIVDAEEGVEWRAGDEAYDRTPTKNTWQRLRYALYSLLPLTHQL